MKRSEQERSRGVFYIVTDDESWFHYYDPETKQQSKTWVSKDDPRATKIHRNKSSGKRKGAVFFIKSGLIESIALESGSSIRIQSHVTNCLSRVFDAVFQRREKIGLLGLILHDDNARLHRAWTTTEYVTGNRVKSYRIPPCSPDLSVWYFFLFQKLKNQLEGIQFNPFNPEIFVRSVHTRKMKKLFSPLRSVIIISCILSSTKASRQS